ncbi:MAG: glycoside hydrolase family 10 protein [Mangrovibacterium sp.]
MRKIFAFLVCLSLSLQVSLAQSPKPKYEFRGAWVATVNNIDWPSKPGLSVKDQQKEAIQMLDMLVENGMNAIIFQARPCCDAFYESPFEPWSRYLTGTPGQSPGYDPMAFWIEESHKRGLEFHAWLNPFRVAQSATEQISRNSVAFRHPEWVVKYDNKLYLNPALSETREYIAEIVRDIVSRYEVDAIHIDDYFYPYPAGKEDFPDEAQFVQNSRGFAKSEKASWRRFQVDEAITLLAKTIKETKPYVKFGVSPFGVWRNIASDSAGSQTRAGVTNYDHLYADVLKWLKNGWIDYLTPQIYWELGNTAADYKTLIDWWSQYSFGRAIYVGHALYKVDANSTSVGWKDSKQIPYQIHLTRTTPNILGSAFYSAKHFNRDLLGLQKVLQNQLYDYTALIPPMTWIDGEAPSAVKDFTVLKKKIMWLAPEYKNRSDEPLRYVIYYCEEGKKLDRNNANNIYMVTTETSLKVKENPPGRRKNYKVQIAVLDRFNNESELSQVQIIKL